MKCIIVAAGYATRLYPLTENFPKPLLEVKEKPIIDWLIDDVDLLKQIDEYIVVTNHRFCHYFEDWSKTKKQNITIVDDLTQSNETRLGAVKDIELAIEKLNINDDILVMAGDNLLDFSLCEFVESCLKKKSSSVMAYEENEISKLQRTGVLEIDKENRITNMEEKPIKPKSNLACPPFYYFVKKDVPLIKEGLLSGCKKDAPGDFLSWLVKKSEVYAFIMPGKRYDIGNLESYNFIKENYKGIN